MHINTNHTIRINYINFELVNTIYNFKEETKEKRIIVRLITVNLRNI